MAMIRAAEQDDCVLVGPSSSRPPATPASASRSARRSAATRCIFIMPDKMSQEKISMLRAYRAEVVITPTAVEPDSPGFYSVSDRLAEEIPGRVRPDQYSNPANPEAHYETTGPEIWEQTDEGRVDAIVISVGTGGTITGVSRYFRASPGGADRGSRPEGSVFTLTSNTRRAHASSRGIGKGVGLRPSTPPSRR